MRVLLVDDNPIFRGFLQDMMQVLGHEIVGTAESVAEALAAHAAFHPDLVMLDISLVDGDGFAVLRGLRAAGAKTPVIMSTANDQRKTRENALNGGAFELMVKPFSLEDVQSVLARLPAS